MLPAIGFLPVIEHFRDIRTFLRIVLHRYIEVGHPASSGERGECDPAGHYGRGLGAQDSLSHPGNLKIGVGQ